MSLKPFTRLQATAVPVLRDNIDTDVLIRVEPLFGGVPRHELGPHCFGSWRYRSDGSPDETFPLNQPRYAGAQILVAGANFGCGSSREGAVWALMAAGFRCVIASSFGDIFYNNCFQNGLLPVVLSRAAATALAAQVERDPHSLVDVDLHALCVTFPDGRQEAFHIPALRRHALMHGLDDIAATLQRKDLIEAWQRDDARRRPWIYHHEDRIPW